MSLQDAVLDPLARHVGQHGKEQLRAIRPGLTLKMTVQPLANDRFELAEQVELGILVRVPVLCFKKVLGEMEEDSVVADTSGIDQRQINTFADDALVTSVPRAN